MPVAVLNNAAALDAYADALTVQFGRPRSSFACNVFNNAIMYQIGYIYADQTNTGDVQWDTAEHQIVPSLTSFRNTQAEGLPPNTLFAGIRVRNAAAGSVARITVI